MDRLIFLSSFLCTANWFPSAMGHTSCKVWDQSMVPGMWYISALILHITTPSTWEIYFYNHLFYHQTDGQHQGNLKNLSIGDESCVHYPLISTSFSWNDISNNTTFPTLLRGQYLHIYKSQVLKNEMNKGSKKTQSWQSISLVSGECRFSTINVMEVRNSNITQLAIVPQPKLCTISTVYL